MSVHIPYTNQCRIINFPLRQRTSSNGFCRVTKYRPCLVCMKPDWCGYTTDEQTSICMRISKGFKGTSRNSGNLFHHNRLFLVASPRTARRQAPPPIEIAPIEIRNAGTAALEKRLKNSASRAPGQIDPLGLSYQPHSPTVLTVLLRLPFFTTTMAV